MISDRVAFLLEPVKWYGRLLGEQALAGLRALDAQGPPLSGRYTAESSSRFFENMAARRLDELIPVDAAMRIRSDRRLARRQIQGELSAVLAAVEQGADVLLSLEAGACNGRSPGRLLELDVPYGEYVAAPLTRWRLALQTFLAESDGNPQIEQ